MKKDVGVKYPHAANLFKFCRRVLDHKYGGIRVIDQDVGQILGFDPADCSHWKKGKKNIRSIQAVRNIAKNLGIDEKLVVDVATGDVGEAEAYYEYSGYGTYTIDARFSEGAKKEFYRHYANSWNKEREIEFKNRFTPDEAKIDRLVNEIHQRINFSEAPLYLPEIIANYPEISLRPSEEVDNPDPAQAVRIEMRENNKMVVTYQGGSEMRPYIRYLIAKALAYHFNPRRESESEALKEFDDYIYEVESHVFAAKLLAPTYLIRKEMKQITVAKDVISQLAESFWVSKTFINHRLRTILQTI